MQVGARVTGRQGGSTISVRVTGRQGGSTISLADLHDVEHGRQRDLERDVPLRHHLLPDVLRRRGLGRQHHQHAEHQLGELVAEHHRARIVRGLAGQPRVPGGEHVRRVLRHDHQQHCLAEPPRPTVSIPAAGVPCHIPRCRRRRCTLLGCASGRHGRMESWTNDFTNGPYLYSSSGKEQQQATGL